MPKYNANLRKNNTPQTIHTHPYGYSYENSTENMENQSSSGCIQNASSCRYIQNPSSSGNIPDVNSYGYVPNAQNIQTGNPVEYCQYATYDNGVNFPQNSNYPNNQNTNHSPLQASEANTNSNFANNPRNSTPATQDHIQVCSRLASCIAE